MREDLLLETGGSPNALGIRALVAPDGRRLYTRADAERLLGLRPRSLTKPREGVEIVEREDGTYATAESVDRGRSEKLAALGVADVASQGDGERAVALEAEVQRCLSEIRQLAVAADLYKDMYLGRLPLGTRHD